MTTKKSGMDSLLQEEDESSANKTLTLPPEEPPIIESDTPPIAEATKPNPGTIRVPDRRGKNIAAREKLYSSLGISRRFAPPITRKRSAVYELLNMRGREDNRLEGKDKFVDPFPYELVPTYTFTDVDEPDLMKREKTMTYFEGGSETVYTDDPVTKGRKVPMSIPRVGAPSFTGGQKVVDIYNEYGRFAWWELHPRNGSNKWRDYSKTPIFHRVDIKWDSPHVSMIRLDFQREAEDYVLKLKPDQLIDLASRLTNPTVSINIGPQELRLALRIRAKSNPEEILWTNPDARGSIKIASIHALDLGILTFVPENEAYYLGDDVEPCFRVPVGNPPFDSLVEFFKSHDGHLAYERLKSDLDFWF